MQKNMIRHPSSQPGFLTLRQIIHTISPLKVRIRRLPTSSPSSWTRSTSCRQFVKNARIIPNRHESKHSGTRSEERRVGKGEGVGSGTIGRKKTTSTQYKHTTSSTS